MNKIYNNLSVDNLTKTEWFKQFNYYQQYQILEGLEANLDISVYAKIEFDDDQMEEIRLGMKDNLDVLIYAKTEYNWKEMQEIREKLLKESTLK